MAHHDRAVRGVKASRVECDEIWSFNYCKRAKLATAKAAPEGAGDAWTWTAIDADSKLIVSYLIGGRRRRSGQRLHDGRCGSAGEPGPANDGRPRRLFAAPSWARSASTLIMPS